MPTPEGGSSGGSIAIGFAIPSHFAKLIASEIIANGTVSHGFFGLTVATVGGTRSPAGPYVTSVTAGGPAQAAGIRTGDLLTEIGGAPATSAEQLLTATLRNRPGDVVRLTYQREGATHEADVTLGRR